VVTGVRKIKTEGNGRSPLTFLGRRSTGKFITYCVCERDE
jgi:hypothetical protein